MKKLISILLCLTMILSFSSCNNDKKAFEISKQAYDHVTAAYKITDDFGSDIYEAWRIAIYDKDEVISDGVSYLAPNLSLSEHQLTNGFACVLADILGEDWSRLNPTDQENYRKMVDQSFEILEDDLFSFCTQAVGEAYKLSNKVSSAQSELDSAKALMKQLSESYSDYEHYPNLKKYYTTTSSFFDFCQNPTGSFEQLKDTVNDYQNEIRDYVNDLDYIFE